MYVVLAINEEMETVAFGPYKTEKKAIQKEKTVKQFFPNVNTGVLKLHDTAEFFN